VRLFVILSTVVSLAVMPYFAFVMARGLLVHSFDVPSTAATIAALCYVGLAETLYAGGLLYYAVTTSRH
jgi:hypothetical protein